MPYQSSTPRILLFKTATRLASLDRNVSAASAAVAQAAAINVTAALQMLESMPPLQGYYSPTFHQNTCKNQILFPDTKHPTEILPSRAMKNIADRLVELEDEKGAEKEEEEEGEEEEEEEGVESDGEGLREIYELF